MGRNNKDFAASQGQEPIGIIPPIAPEGGMARTRARAAEKKAAKAAETGEITQGAIPEEQLLAETATSRRAYVKRTGSAPSDRTAAPTARAPKPKPITSLTRGVHVGQTMKTNEFRENLDRIHTLLGTHLQELKIKANYPEATDVYNQAGTVLGAARQHIYNGDKLKRGEKVNGKVQTYPQAANHEYHSAFGKLSSVHELLTGPTLRGHAQAGGVDTPLPELGFMNEMKAHADTLQRIKPAASFKSVSLAGQQIPTAMFTPKLLSELRKTEGSESLAVQKVEAAVRGTSKPRAKVSAEGRIVSPGRTVTDKEQIATTPESGTKTGRTGMTRGGGTAMPKRAKGQTFGKLKARIKTQAKLGKGQSIDIGKKPTF